MRYKIFLRSLIGLIFVLGFVSCEKSQTGSTEDTLDRIRRTGVIEGCTAIDPPYSQKDAKTGAYNGLYVDAMNLIAQKMNAKINWHETTFGNSSGEIASGRCDVFASDFYANIPRATLIAFTSPPLGYMGLGILVRKNDSRFGAIKDPKEFDKPNLTIAVATGEAGDLYVTENFKKAKIKRIDVEAADLMRFCVEVSTRRADAALAGPEFFVRYTKQHPETVDIFATRPFSLNPLGWGVRQTDYKWLQFLNTSLQFLDTQGTIDQLEKKYHVHLLHIAKQYQLQ